MQTQSHPPMRSGSPNGQRSSLAFAPHDDHFVHTPQQSLYGNAGMESSNEFAPFSEGDPQQSVGPFEAGSFRNNSMFGSFFPPRTRPSVAGPSYDPNAAYSQFNGMSISDVFGTHQPLQSMSQQQQQQQQQQQSNGIRSYDFSNEGQTMKPNGKPIFANMDPFNTGTGTASNSLLHSHQLNQLNNKSAQIQQQQQQQQQQHLHGFVSQSFATGLLQAQQQPHSQVPFGPQLAPNNGAMGGSGLSLSNGMGTVSVTTQQEEISTIFVVGFPEDMQEREFQNMFTFSSGFEAATLKIPNKDSTAYGTNAPSTANGVNSAGRGVFQLGYPFNGPNDPYNLLTVNQGGVVVDSRDGTTASWPSSDPTDLSGGLNSNSMNVQGPNPGPPRKQIIGFAKFRTRAEALAARDLLQGRRVDIEKGAVLKAEMAKKNLHTKRGVGPLGAPLSVSVGGAGMGNGGMGGGVGSAMNGVSSLSLGSIAEGLSGMTGMLSPVSGPGPETLSARERELGPLGPMGLGVLARRDRMETQEEERESRRRRDFGSVSSVSNGLNALSMLGSRGPRERLEEDEREREKRRKEKEVERNGRLRAGNQAAYDAFHSVTVPSRNSSLATTALGSGVLSPSESIGGYSFPGSQMFSPQESANGHGSDGWPTGPSQGMRRLGNFGMSNLSRPVPFGITTNTNNAHTSSSLESSPTEPNADPASLSSRSGNSDKAPLQESDMFSPPSDMALASHPSMSSVSSLGSRSRPYSPTNDTAMSSSGFLPPLPEQQHHSGQDQGQTLPTVPSSGSSSVSETRSSSSDEDVSRTVGNIDVDSQQGTISPQLPSPNSGASSGTGSRTNASDQNPPINTLYVGNLPTSPIPGSQPNFLEESLRSLFARCAGYRKLCFRQKSNGPMCFVEFEDVSYATKALNELYGHNLNGLVKGGIRLSYSKNPLGVRTPTNVANGSGLQQGLQTFGPGSFSSLQDAFSRQSTAGILSIDMSSIRGPRRDANEVASPSHYFASSPPPPRFFSPPPSTGFGFTGQTSAPGLVRSSSQSYTSTFSPFGSSTPPDMTAQAAATSESADPFQSNNLSTAQSLEATRAG